MKKFIILMCLFPLASFATTTKENTTLAAYQELCAKEHDPIKRQNYCVLFEKNGQVHPASNIFRKDTAIV
ncbi:Uncharacterised protein [Legionella beliardensis]|uniref:Uncharacterized protein n=1 Tax=Legionella beliardensis TaxID=91822 RepID=A0A378HYZ8_9GAMM|nr:hypothetical protein [Legionella beliardensis]STX27605.1 Uncharacterised protein [Legionella beliardensis]